MVKSIFKENREKLQLKRDGHFLITRIKWKGYSMDAVYHLMAENMQIPEEQCHFSKMNTLRELRPAVACLRLLEERLPKTVYALKGPRPRRDKSIHDDRENVIAVRDQIEPKTVAVKEPHVQKPTKRGSRLAKKMRDTLPRPQVLEALEKMRRDHAQGIQYEVSSLSYTVSPRQNWVYTLFKKLWPKRNDPTRQ